MKAASSALNDVWNLDDTVYLDFKLLAELGSNRFNDGQVVTTSGVKEVARGIDSLVDQTINFWPADHAFNNKNRNTMKWLVCDQGVVLNEEETGGGWRAMDLEEDETEHGWWGEIKSNGSGVFSSPQWVQSDFYATDGTTPFGRAVNKFSIYFTEGYGNMKQFLAQYKDGAGNWINVAPAYTTAPDEYIIEFDLGIGNEIIVYGLKLTIYSTHEPNHYARVSEFNAYFMEDLSDDVVSVDVNSSRENYEEGTVPIGHVTSNTANVELDNTQGLYNPNNDDSPYAPYIGANVRMEFHVGAKVGEVFEYVPLGEFWSDEWGVDSGGMQSDVTLRDFSKFIQDETLEDGHMWHNTTLPVICRDIMARLGFPPDKIVIDDDAGWRGFTIIYIKDDSFWDLLSEVAFADQGIYGFNDLGQFVLESYDALDGDAEPDLVYRWDRNIVDGSMKSILYINKVTVNSYPTEQLENGTKPLWRPPSPQILSWGKLQTNISKTATSIPIAQAKNQTVGNLTENGWYENNGIFFLPQYQTRPKTSTRESDWQDFSGPLEDIDKTTKAYRLSGGELIKYKRRSDSHFLECERGFLNTTPKAWNAGHYVGEARYYQMEFDNAPASAVKFPFVTAIDTLKTFADEGVEQAEVIFWEHTHFTGKLCIANLVNYYTWLEGSGQTYKDYRVEEIDSPLGFATSISGNVVTEKDGKEEVNGETREDPSATNKDFVRRYGKNEIEVDNDWIQSKDHAQFVADRIIEEYKDGRKIIELDVFPNPLLELSDRVRIQNFPQLDIENLEYHVMSRSFSYDGGLSGSVTLREVKK